MKKIWFATGFLSVMGPAVVYQTAEGASFRSQGTDCVQNFTTAPEIKFDNSNGTAVNTSTSIRNHYCGGTSTSDKTLQTVDVIVIDRSTVGGVECTAINGSFTAGPGSSSGSDAAPKTIPLNITDAQWVEAVVRCDVPAFAGGLGSGVQIVSYNTN